jgi:hypothetical protein
LTVNPALALLMPPKATLTMAVPMPAIRLAGIAAVICVALTAVVGTVVPFHCTAAPEVNPVPFTVNVKAAVPAATVLGLSDVMVGMAGARVTLRPVLVVAEPPTESVTVTTTLYGEFTRLPAAAAPPIVPLNRLIVIPGGSPVAVQR